VVLVGIQVVLTNGSPVGQQEEGIFANSSAFRRRLVLQRVSLLVAWIAIAPVGALSVEAQLVTRASLFALVDVLRI